MRQVVIGYHFLDDFMQLQRTQPDLEQFMNQFYTIMEDIGMPVAVHKTLGPAQVIEYLGLTLDFYRCIEL